MSELLKSIVGVKSTDWWKTKGLILGSACVFVVSTGLHTILDNKTLTLSSFFLLSIAWVIVWLLKNRIKKFKKGKVGILICIHSKDQTVDERVREDFIRTLKNSLDQNNQSNFAQIEIAPYHIALRHDNAKDAIPLLKKAKGHFLLYGLARKRGQRYILDLTAYVGHKELSQDMQRLFQNDIASAWVSRYNLEKADEVFELLENSSEIVSLCSRYIMGLAALASGDFVISEVLLVTVKKELANKALPEFPQIREIRKSLTIRLNTIYLRQAYRYILIWNETGDKHNISIANELLEKVFGAYKKHAEYLTLKAIIEVVMNSNFALAKHHLISIKKKHRNSSVWHLNIGFIKACQGDENGALASYDRAIEMNEGSSQLTLEKISEFEGFLSRFVTDTRKPLIYYLLGLLNEKFKGDMVRAKQDYEQFLELDQPKSFPRSRKIAKRKITD